MSDISALTTYLKPLDVFLNDASINEILINQPGIVFIEQCGKFTTHEIKNLTYHYLVGLSNLIARFSDQHLSEREPLLSAVLPTGHRVQIVLPPATSKNKIVLSIRKQTVTQLTLDDYDFKNTKPSNLKLQPHSSSDNLLTELFKNKQYAEFLKQAVIHKKNILVSGATSTGKTTFLNACLQLVPEHEHIITIEDVPEIKLTQPLHTALLVSKGQQGLSNISIQQLIQASLRLRPDRIILGELRGSEAADFINATATGHDGSLSSLHASSPWTAFMRLTHMVKLSGIQLSRKAILEDLSTLIDIVVQLQRRFDGENYVREISEIYYADENLAHS